MANKTTVTGKLYGYFDQELEPALSKLFEIMQKTVGQNYYELKIDKLPNKLKLSNTGDKKVVFDLLNFNATGRHDFRHTMDDFFELTLKEAKLNPELSDLYTEFEKLMQKGGQIYLIFDYIDEQPCERLIVKNQYHIIIDTDIEKSKIISLVPRVIDIEDD